MAREGLVQVDNKLRLEIKELCDLIVGSPPETIIKGEIESRAFYLAHHPSIMNGKTTQLKYKKCGCLIPKTWAEELDVDYCEECVPF